MRHDLALKTLGLHPENAHCAAALYVPLPKSPTNQHRPRPPTARRRRTKAAGPRHDSTLCFQYVNDAATQGYRAGNREPHICPLAACFQHVYVRKRVNTLFFALAGCRCLIPQAFPHGYRAVSLQQPAGGDVSPLFRCVAASSLLSTTQRPGQHPPARTRASKTQLLLLVYEPALHLWSVRFPCLLGYAPTIRTQD